MKNNQQITAELLIKIAQKLGDNWRYHSILSDKERYRGHYLSNGAGLYISVSNAYGFNLPQWVLSYYHPTHRDTLTTFCQIGCSLNKPIQSIVADLKDRLLSCTGKAYKSLEALTEKESVNKSQVQLSHFIVESLKKVLNLSSYHDHRYCESYRIENDQGSRLASIRKWASKGDCFNMEIDGLTAEKIIKIMTIVNEN
ncbi:hypothetical protein BCT75_04295 [Vibrio lentus]|uniref:hypothetical protein n=1 Tax=Vibrio lentus TaxID=136468 RepID=UPI000C851DC7|nr:hypothetical protein [Vibrio lentus]PML45610.1 hypothetical protein BCT75_04295 [Vibrio lentus]